MRYTRLITKVVPWLSLMLVFIMSACGAKKQVIRVSSEPAGAWVYVNGKQTITTPDKLEISKKQKDVVLTLQREGYKTATIALKRGVNPWWFPRWLLTGTLVPAGGTILSKTLTGAIAGEGGFSITKGEAIGWAAGTGCMLGVVPVVDFLMTGEAYKFSPPEVHVRLEKTEGTK